MSTSSERDLFAAALFEKIGTVGSFLTFTLGKETRAGARYSNYDEREFRAVGEGLEKADLRTQWFDRWIKNWIENYPVSKVTRLVAFKEFHKDGNPHCHMVINDVNEVVTAHIENTYGRWVKHKNVLKVKYDSSTWFTSNDDRLDPKGNVNVQPVNSMLSVLQYIVKRNLLIDSR